MLDHWSVSLVEQANGLVDDVTVVTVYKWSPLVSGASVKKRNKYGATALKLALESGQAGYC